MVAGGTRTDAGGEVESWLSPGISFWLKTAIGVPAYFALVLFLPAGTFDWPLAWLYLAVFAALVLVMIVWMARVNPEIFVARSRIGAGTKRWDLVLVPLLLAIMTGQYVVAGLDAGRFHWQAISWWAVALGYAAFVPGMLISGWAEAVNKFFEPTVRIQSDRGHRVIDTGPYAYVRHPGYVGAILILVGTSLALGSLWSLIPAALATGILVLRTKWEDETLRAELAGYAEFVQRVRWRLLPGVW